MDFKNFLKRQKKNKQEAKLFIRAIKYSCVKHGLPLETALKNFGYVKEC